MTSERWCSICGTSYSVQRHHIIFKSECKQLEFCKMDIVLLCNFHHNDHKEGVHHNKELNRKLRLEFQNKLELLFDSEFLTETDIMNVLQISERATSRLCKTIKRTKGKFARENVIRSCMGGITIEEDIKK